MQLNDPFGRVSRKREAAYNELRDRLRAGGIEDPASVDAFRRNVSRMAGRLALLIGAAAGVLSMLFPRAAAVLLVFAVLGLLWIGTGYLQTIGHLQRYRRESSTAAARLNETTADKEEEDK